MKLLYKIAITTAFIGIFVGFFSGVVVPEFNEIISMINSIDVSVMIVNGLGFLFCFVNPALVTFYLSYLLVIIPIKIYNLILNKVVNFSKE